MTALDFKQVYEKHKSMVYNLCLNYLQNTEDAEETTQDVFLIIHTKYSDFKEEAALSTWIYRITINKCLDLIRSRNRKKRFAFISSLFNAESGELQHDKPHFDHPGVALEQKEALEKIFSCINELPENQKTALILSKLENKSQQEIALIMDLSPKAVESLVQRAKTSLNKKLNPAKDKNKSDV
jgi:RNA polymerase sigma factor (sigma-70 family)